MQKVLDWEHKLIKDGLKLAKFYLSVDIDQQLVRFHERLADPLKFWKFSKNDIHARKKWEKYTKYKNQMFQHTSSNKSPWITVNSNSKIEARLNCMLYVVRLYGNRKFVPLTGVDVSNQYSVEIDGVLFEELNSLQHETLKQLAGRK